MKEVIKYKIAIESERLLLRNLTPLDKDFLLDLWTNDQVTKYMGGPRLRDKLSISLDEDITEPYKYEFDLWILVDKSTGKSIGHCGLLDKEVEGNSEIEVVYVIDPNFWGKGYATEISKAVIDYAFSTKKLNRVIALIKPNNIASEKVASNCGMVHEKDVVRETGINMKLYSKSSL
ncbi:MAG: GNAT family N-acetyltransferase [Spirochaetaceae bacterium]